MKIRKFSVLQTEVKTSEGTIAVKVSSNNSQPQQQVLSNIPQIEDPTKTEDALEIKDPEMIFNNVWNKIENSRGKENMRFPREIIWLMGAPGSGKSYNAPWILKVRGISAKEVIISDLLTSPEAVAIKKQAGLVGDSLVLELLLETLLQPQYANGVLVDGFPRTKVQVECIKLLRDKMASLRNEYLTSELSQHFRRPVFRVAVLFIDEKGSVERQLQRGREAREHNLKVRETGIGSLKEERPTDYNEELARRRYAVFKSHYSTLIELKKIFPFSVINTKASVIEVRDSILKEFQYQSSLELTGECFDRIQKIPVAIELIENGRQNLIKRLDNYASLQATQFNHIISILKAEFIPVLLQHALVGEAIIRSSNKIFDDGSAIQMTVDILSERGYHVIYNPVVEQIPSHIDLQTGKIHTSKHIAHSFQIKFKRAIIRRDPSLFAEELPV